MNKTSDVYDDPPPTHYHSISSKSTLNLLLMLTKQSWKKLFQATATTALGVALFTAFGTSKASAVSLQKFNISGTFGNQAFFNYPGPFSNIRDFIDGSFDGTYTVDVDKLSNLFDGDRTTNVDLEDWDVNLRNSSGVIINALSSPPSNPNVISLFGTLRDDFTTFGQTETRPFRAIGYSLGLFTNIDPTGKITPSDSRIGTYVIASNFIESISVTSFQSEPVPEPFTIGGTAVAGAMGFWLKRKKQKDSQTV